MSEANGTRLISVCDQEIAAFDLVGRPITELPGHSSGQSAVGKIVEDYILV